MFAKVPSEIAKCLNLPNPENYTGHCLRRSLATCMASSNATGQELQSVCRWSSTSTANHYIQRNDTIKNNAIMKISGNQHDEVKVDAPSKNICSNSAGELFTALFNNCQIQNLTVNYYQKDNIYYCIEGYQNFFDQGDINCPRALYRRLGPEGIFMSPEVEK